MNARYLPALETRLQPLLDAEKKLRVLRWSTVYHLILAVVAPLLLWWWIQDGGAAWQAVLFGGIAWLAGLMIVQGLVSAREPDLLPLARRVEASQPELKGALLAALEQPNTGKQPLNYLSRRVVETAVVHSARHDWVTPLFRRDLTRSSLYSIAAKLLLFGGIGVTLIATQKTAVLSPVVTTLTESLVVPSGAISVEVHPGNVEVERGGKLLVEAHFPGEIPEDVKVILMQKDGSIRSTVPMNRTVDMARYGAVVTEIQEDSDYRVVFANGQSESYRITTFEYPKLVRVDATVTPPGWMKQEATEVKNSLNFSVPEGAQVDFKITVNKSLAAAELFGEDKSIVPLIPREGAPTVLQGTLRPQVTQKYRVHLVDDQERASAQTPVVTVRVLQNVAPKIEVIFPKRDLAVSPLQELPVEGKIWDDVGVQRAGATFMLGGESHEVLLDAEGWQGSKAKVLQTLLNLEKLQAKPKQLFSYYLWAEDQTSQGQPRRSMSDMFFAEVRHFEDIFREAESQPGQPGQPQGGQTDELVKLQKQVVNAVWRLIRETGAGKTMEAITPDLEVVQKSGVLALEKTEAAMGQVQDEEVKAALQQAAQSMTKANQQLSEILLSKKAESLASILQVEREALEYLYQAQSREHRVSRQQNSSSQGQSQQGQQQLMQLEIKQQERRYEEERQAGEESDPAQQENLQVLNRLKELAARQEALAQKMKELEQAMAEAKTDEQRAEAERQLKRLQEEQEQLVNDMDELRDRMEQPDNLANMSESREQLQQAREQSQAASEQMQQQQMGQATASATRAQRQLEEVRDDFREKTAKQFSEEMKQLKQATQELLEQQQALSEDLEKQAAEGRQERRDAATELERGLDAARLARQMESQQEALKEVLEQAKQISEAAEQAEPSLSSALYDAVREVQAGGVEQALDTAREMTQASALSEAQQQEQKAAQGMSTLAESIEKAADRVLGSEAESLRMARAELDRLLNEIDPDKSEPPTGSTMEGDKRSASDQNHDEGKVAGAPSPMDEKDAPSQADRENGNPTASGTPPAATAAASPGKEGQGGEQPGTPGQQGRSGPEPAGASGSAPDRQRNSTSGRRSLSGAQDASQTGGGSGGEWFFDEASPAQNPNPVTGSGYDQWSDRLRRVEELLESPDLRTQAARVREDARQLRVDSRRNNNAPQAETIAQRITNPLTELRDQVAEALVRKEAKNPMAPLDRDPVPTRYREMVRRYYEALGSGK